MTIRRSSLVVVLAMLAPLHAAAAPCAGFTDVDDTSPFCRNVEWIRNRGVTLGCTGSLYCPAAAVSRLQMAAFMNRLGTALTPIMVKVELASGAQDLDLSPVVCTTTDQSITSFPRRAIVDVAVSASSPGAVDIGVRGVYSTNGGASWTPIAAVPSLAYVAAGQWAQASDFSSLDLAVGQTVRFGAQVTRSGGGAADLSDSRCLLRAQIGSRDGASTPF